MGDCLCDIEVHSVEAQMLIEECVQVFMFLREEVGSSGELDEVDVKPHFGPCRELEYRF